MTLEFLLAISTPIIIGFLIVQLLIPDLAGSHLKVGFIAKFFLAPGVGFTLASCILFLLILFFNPEHLKVGIFIIEILTIILLVVGLYFYTRGRNEGDSSGKQKIFPSLNMTTIITTAVFIILALNFLADWQRESFQTPFGEWDAWAIWNLRAGFLASGGEWVKGFSPELFWSHLDYPLFLPLNVARLWVIQGERSVLSPILLGLIFQLSLVGLLAASIRVFRGNLQGLLAGILGFVVLFVSLNFKLYADIPIAYYFLAANALLLIVDVSSENEPRYLILAGFLVGASLWTKNEGWAFLISIIVSKLLLDLVSRKSSSQSDRWWGYFLSGLTPLLMVTLYFKIAYAPPGDILSGLDLLSIKTKLVSVSRYLIIFRSARGQITNYGNLVIPTLPLLAIYGIIVGISFPKSQSRGIIFLTLRILLLGVIYFLVYLLTPNDLNWHLNTSIERLVTQIMPSFLLLYFLVISTINKKNGESAETFSLDWSRLRSKSR
jgi:hypothetical protein